MKIFKPFLLFTISVLMAVSAVRAPALAAPKEHYSLEASTLFSGTVQRWFFKNHTVVAVGASEVKLSRGRETRTLALPGGFLKAIVSRNGRYLGLVSLREAGHRGRNKTLRLDIYTTDGREQYSLERIQYYDDPLPEMAVSDRDGAVVVGRVPTGELWFYDGGGRLLRHNYLFPGSDYDLEKILQVSFSADGSQVTVAATRKGMAPVDADVRDPSAHPFLFAFSPDGALRWQKALPGYMIQSMATSPDGRFIAAAVYSIRTNGELSPRSLIYDRAGNLQTETDLLFKRAAFSPDGRYLLLAENRRARLLDLSEKSVLWDDTVSGKKAMIAAVALAENARRAILLMAQSEFRGNHFIFTRPVLQIKQMSGQTLQEIKIQDQTFTVPALTVSPDAGEILIGFHNSYQIYRLK